jgi:hypothetical protein
MRFSIVILASLLFTAVLTVSCGSPGAPVPPQLELPRPVSDLHAFRKGNAVQLTWSSPTQTTEHGNLRRRGTMDICRAVGPELKTCGTPPAQLPFQPPPRDATAEQRAQTYTDQLPTNVPSASTVLITYAISVLNSYGRSAGFSNQVQVPAAPTLPPPANFHAQLTADGVQLSWDPVAAPQDPALRFIYRVFRREHGRREQGPGKDAIAGELPVSAEQSPNLTDRSFEWEKTYDYRLTVVTIVTSGNGAEQQIEGDDTTPKQVVAHDVSPPATPTGLEAVFSGPGQKPFIDLVWSPNTEPDLAGYNVYRREDGNEWRKVNSDLVKPPAFRDSDLLPGHAYSYCVSAVDLRGNESDKSQSASQAARSDEQ